MGGKVVGKPREGKVVKAKQYNIQVSEKKER